MIADIELISYSSRKRHYQLHETLGVGGFAEVKRATFMDNGQDVRSSLPYPSLKFEADFAIFLLMGELL